MRTDKDLELFGVCLGVIATLFLWFFVWISTDAKTAVGWCEDVAQHDTTVSYQVAYDKCWAECEQRRK